LFALGLVLVLFSPCTSALRVLQFGATGNLGVPTLNALRAAHDVTAFVRCADRLRDTQQGNLDGVGVIVGDALDYDAVQAAVQSSCFDVVVSTAGCVDNEATTIADAGTSTFCRIFDHIATACCSPAGPRRAIYTAGLTLLPLPGLPGTALQEVVGDRVPQYVAHQINFQRLLSLAPGHQALRDKGDALEWTLLCPGSLVDDETVRGGHPETPLLLSTDVVPAFAPGAAFSPWMLRGPFKVPCVLLPFLRRQGERTLPYRAVADAIVRVIEADDGRYARRRVGLANPAGVRLSKSKEASAAERERRAAREAIYRRAGSASMSFRERPPAPAPEHSPPPAPEHCWTRDVGRFGAYSVEVATAVHLALHCGNRCAPQVRPNGPRRSRTVRAASSR